MSAGEDGPFFAAKPPPALTPEQVEAFKRDGFLVIKGWLTSEQIDSLTHAWKKLVSEFDPAAHASVFESGTSARDSYFLGSGDKVRYFLEAGARNPDGSLNRPLDVAINKVGHALHYTIPEFRDIVFSERAAGVCSALGYEKVVVPQSMVICKQPEVGGAVHPHVDSAFIYTEPHDPDAVLGFWTPLQPSKLSNGCLYGVPGSHKRPVKRLFKRTADGTSTEFVPPEEEAFDTTGGVPIEMDPGDMLLIHGAVVHYSHANPSPRSRLAYTWHLVDCGRGRNWSPEAWLQREDGKPFPELY